MPCSNLFQTSNLTVTGNKIQWHCQRGSRQHSLPSAQPTKENNLYDSLVCPVQGTRVEEKLGSVSALIPDVSADRVLQNGANPGNLSQCSQQDFSGQDKELSSVTHGVSVSGTEAPPPSPSYRCEKGINYVRTGTSAYYSCTITTSPLTQGSKNRQILCHHQPQMSFPEAHPSPRPIKGLWVLQKYTSETE